jgi:hypothetical protein
VRTKGSPNDDGALTFAEIAKIWAARGNKPLTLARIGQICEEAEQKLAFGIIQAIRGHAVETREGRR